VCRYYLLLANDLKYGDTALLEAKLAEISKLLEGYSKAILDSEFPPACKEIGYHEGRRL